MKKKERCEMGKEKREAEIRRIKDKGNGEITRLRSKVKEMNMKRKRNKF